MCTRKFNNKVQKWMTLDRPFGCPSDTNYYFLRFEEAEKERLRITGGSLIPCWNDMVFMTIVLL